MNTPTETSVACAPPVRRAARTLPVLGALALAAAFALATPAGASAQAGAGARTLAFERGGAGGVASADGSAARRVAEGVDPAVSPDGSRVAYTRDTSPANGVVRHIAVADVAGRTSRVMASVPGDNACAPAWSPDGATLLVNVYFEKGWGVGVVNADDSGFRWLFRPDPKGRSWWGAAFAPDGASVFCQDLDEIARFTLDGRKAWSAPASALFPTAGLNSGARLSPSPDGKQVLVDVDMDEDVAMKDWDGPPPAVFAVDLATRTARRLTPKGAFVWEPAWLDASAFLAIAIGPNDKEPSVVRVPFAGGAPALLVKSARCPTISSPK